MRERGGGYIQKKGKEGIMYIVSGRGDHKQNEGKEGIIYTVRRREGGGCGIDKFESS